MVCVVLPVEGMLKESMAAALGGMGGAVDWGMDGVGMFSAGWAGCGLNGSNIVASTPEATPGGFSSGLRSTMSGIQRY